jgi:GAF domain-containing protein
MVILDKAQKVYSAWRSQFHGFLLHEAQTLGGVLGLALVMRSLLLLGLILRFTIDREGYLDSPLWAAVQSALVGFFSYILLLSCLRAFKPPWFFSDAGKLLQISIDIVAYSLFYFLTKGTQSHVFFAYFLPLFVAAHYFGSKRTLVFFLFTTVAFWATLLAIVTLFEPYSEDIYVRVFLPRESLLAIVTFAYLFRRMQVSVVNIERERLYEEARRRMQELTSLDKVSRTIVSTLELNQVLNSIMEHATELLKAEAGSVLLLDDKNGKLIFEAVVGAAAEMTKGLSFPSTMGIAGWVLQEHHPQLVPHVSQDSRFHPGIDSVTGLVTKSLLCVPLEVKGKVIGVLEIINKTRGNFSEDDLRLLTYLAPSAAVAIENARLYQNERRRTAQLASLNQASQAVTASLELNQVLAEIVSLASKVATSDYAAVVLVDAEGRLSRSVEYLPGVPTIERRIRDEGFTRWIVRSRQAIVVDDIGEDSTVNPRPPNGAPCTANPFIVEAGVKSFVGLPLLAKDCLLGVLYLRSLRPSNYRDQLPLLATFANQMALAIENARLYEAEAQRRQEAETLREVASALNANLDRERVLQLILEQLARVVNYDSASVMLVSNGMLDIVAHHGFRSEGQQFTPLRVEALRHAQEVLEHRLPIIIPDTATDSRWLRLPGSEYIRCWLGVPLVAQGRTIGLLNLDNEQPGFYNERDAELAVAFADQAAIAIENARLLQEAQQRVQELSTLQQVSVQLTAAVSRPKDLLKMIVDSAVSTIPSAKRGIVHKLDPASQELCPEVWSGMDNKGAIGKTRMKIGEGVAGYALAVGDLVNVPDTSLDQRFQSHPQSDGRCKSLLVAPMLIRSERIGTISVDSPRANAFTVDDERLLTALATHAAYAIQNAGLLNRMVGYVATLEKLAESSKKLLTHTDLHGLFTFAAQQGAQIFSAEDCSLFVKDGAKGTIHAVASTGIPPNVISEYETPIGSAPGVGLTPFVAATGQILNFAGDTFQDHPAWKGEFLGHLRHLPSGVCNSLLIGPLEGSKREIVGVMKLENKSGEDAASGFSESDEKMFRTFASQVGIAIERAQLFQKITELARESERERLREDLHDAMNLVHALLMLEAERVLELLQARKYQETENGLRALWKNARFINFDQLGRLLDDMRYPILADKGLAIALQSYIERIRAFEVHLDIQGRGRLPFRIAHVLYRIAQQALGNVAKHARLDEVESGKSQVTLVIEPENVTLIIADNGVGFDAKKELERRDALGLSVMRRWARSIDAQLEIRSRPGKGTTVRVVVPY